MAVALPFLDAMWPARAQAQAARPRRFFVMTGVNGVTTNTWFPTGGEKDFTLGASMAALEPFKANLIIPDGFTKMQRGTTDGTAHGRGAASAISGWTSGGKNGIADGASIDQVLANAIGGRDQGQVPDHGEQGLQLSLLHGRPEAGPPGRARSQEELRPPVHRVHRPGRHRRRAPDPGAAANAADLARLRAREKSILDAAIEQYRKLSTKVGASDRQRLEKHLSGIRQVELQLNNAATGTASASKSCSKPAAPGVAADPYQAVGKANMDLCALAFACDLTRVGGMQWISHNTVFNWLGATQQHHPLSHSHGSAAVDAQLTKIVAWHSEQAAAFLTQLKSFPEGEGTVFDNTVFMWTQDQSVGSHKFDRGPILIAAGKFPLATGGTLQTGRYVKVPGGTPHTSILQAITMAVANIKMPVFGGWDKGPLAGLMSSA